LLFSTFCFKASDPTSDSSYDGLLLARSESFRAPKFQWASLRFGVRPRAEGKSTAISARKRTLALGFDLLSPLYEHNACSAQTPIILQAVLCIKPCNRMPIACIA
jgi:hypothetical protein